VKHNHEQGENVTMSNRERGTPPRWLYFVIGIGSLIASGIYIGSGITAGFSTGRIVRVAAFGFLGILWVFLYGQGRARNRSRDEDRTTGCR
jgi:hypothetical protein